MLIIGFRYNRGVKDILIACVDGLNGFPEAIASIYPETEVQLCVIHQVRNSMKYVASKHQKAFMADLKPVYRATSKSAAETALDELNGFPEAIASIYPETEVQLCVIHQVRNSMKYVASKHQKAFMADLKPVYRATSKSAAETALDEL